MGHFGWGYNTPYDPRDALEGLKQGSNVWSELWENLYHQGDVGTASYVCVVEIAALITNATKPDWNAYALIASIEEARHSPKNPPVPAWLTERHQDAWRGIARIACVHLSQSNDQLLNRSILAVLAHTKGLTLLGTLALWSEEELQDLLAHQGSGPGVC